MIFHLNKIPENIRFALDSIYSTGTNCLKEDLPRIIFDIIYLTFSLLLLYGNFQAAIFSQPSSLIFYLLSLTFIITTFISIYFSILISFSIKYYIRSFVIVKGIHINFISRDFLISFPILELREIRLQTNTSNSDYVDAIFFFEKHDFSISKRYTKIEELQIFCNNILKYKYDFINSMSNNNLRILNTYITDDLFAGLNIDYFSFKENQHHIYQKYLNIQRIKLAIFPTLFFSIALFINAFKVVDTNYLESAFKENSINKFTNILNLDYPIETKSKVRNLLDSLNAQIKLQNDLIENKLLQEEAQKVLSETYKKKEKLLNDELSENNRRKEILQKEELKRYSPKYLDTNEIPDDNYYDPSYDYDLENYLTINMGRNSDAVIRVIDVNSNSTIRYFFIKSGSRAVQRNIPIGKYKLKIAFGFNWATKLINGKEHGRFLKNAIYKLGTDILDYNLTYSENGYSVPSYEISLDVISKYSSSNYDTKNISEEEFNR